MQRKDIRKRNSIRHAEYYNMVEIQDELYRLRQVLFAKRVPVKQEVKPPIAVWLEQTAR